MIGLEILTFLVLGGMIVFVAGFFWIKDIFRDYEDEISTYQEENNSLVNAITRQEKIIDIYQMVTKVSFEDENDTENNEINNNEDGDIE